MIAKQGLSKTDRIITNLSRQIITGHYIAGTALPTEAELCEEFQTSRNRVREAQRSLAEKRLVEMKRFRGVFVLPRSQWNYLDSDVLQWMLSHEYDSQLIGAIQEVRNLVEPAIARWAAERATSQELAVIESSLDAMSTHRKDREMLKEADIRFHEGVLDSVHNPILQQLGIAMSSLQRAVFERTWVPDETHIPHMLQQHQKLYEAIRHQDADASEQAALVIIAGSVTHL